MQSFAVCALLVTLSVFAAARPNFDMEMAKQAVICMKEHNVKMTDFEKIKMGDGVKPEDVSDDMKCAIHCLTQKMGFMDENGKLKADEVKAALSEEEKSGFDAAFDECNAKNGANPCETAFLTFECMAAQEIHNMA